MEKKMKILAFAAVALMFAVCFIGFVAISDDVVDAEGTESTGGESSTTPVNKGPLGDMCPEGMTYANNEYTFTDDVTITLTKDLIGDDGLKGVKFVGGDTLKITSANGGHYALDVTYNFGIKIGSDAGRIFQVSNFVLENASLNVVQLDDEKTIENNQPGGSVFGEAQVTVQGKSTMTITTNEHANRVFYNNNSSLSIIGENAKVILNKASSLTASLSMTNGAVLEIVDPINTAGNFYPNINNDDADKKVNIVVTGASNGNHGLFFYGSISNAKDVTTGVLKNCIVKTDGIVGFYSHKSVDATGSTFEAKELVVAKSVAANMANVKGATFNVTKVGAIDPLDEYKPANEKKLYLNGVIFNGNTVIDSGASLVVEEGKTLTVAEGATISVFGTIVNNGTIIVNDAAGLKTAVAAGGRISLANDIKIIDCDNTDDRNGLKITKSVEIVGNDKKISFTNKDTIYGLVFSGNCGGSKLSNVSLDFGGFAKYGLCIRNMSEGNDGITIENVTIDNYGKTGIDLNGVYGKIKLKNVDVKGNGHYVDTVTNLTRGHGYALVIDDIKDRASFTTENCTITSVNVHNFCGKIHSVDLSGCNGLLFVSVEDGSKNTLTSVYDNGIDHKKQTGKDTIVNIEGPSKGLLIDGIILFPTGFDTNKYAIFNTATSIGNVDKGDDNRGSFEILRAYRVCYGKAFFDANVKIVGDYTINCDIVIPNDITVTIGGDATLTISDGVKLCNGGTITNNGTISLSSLDVLKESNITSGNVILNGNITINKSDVISGVKLFIGNDANIIVASEITLSVKGTNDTITLVKGAELQFPVGSTFSGTIFGPNGNKLVANGMKAGEGGITITGGSLIINGDIISESGSVAGATVTVTGDGIKISGSLDTNVTMVIEKDTIVTVKSGGEFSFNGTITNNGTLRIEDSTTITTVNTSKVVNNGVIADERAKNASAVPVDKEASEGIVVAKNNADKYRGDGIDVIVQDPETAKKTDGTVIVDENKFIFIDAITTTGKLNIVMNDGYKQYTVTIPEGTAIAAGTVISVSFIEYQSDSVTRYQINTPGIENFSMKLPCQIGFKKAKVYCDDSELGVSKVRYDAGTGYVTFDASHNSVFTIVLSNTSHTGATTVSGGDASNDYSLVIAITVLVASLGFLAYVIRKK
ncbi:hypothetical protein [Candidatus Methanarcanum hacksteinii]|uniref:hypothetical protein n=1 Tax=Candidatus Methanarcanum hacksteinii TaxID=2911857 RepID=UPI0037DD0B21